MSSPTEAASRATDLHTAASHLHTGVAAVDARQLDLRDTMQLVGRALGELAAMSESLSRDFTVSASPTAASQPPPSTELVRRTHELTSSLCAARRNAELVNRHLPRHGERYGSTSPRRIA